MNMNASTEEQPSSSLDFVKWSLVTLLLAGSVVGNYLFAEQSVLVRAIAVVLTIIVAGLIAMQTDKGRIALAFAKESKTEAKKVIWPTGPEAKQTTFIVLLATVIMSFILWFLDFILLKVVGFITGLQV